MEERMMCEPGFWVDVQGRPAPAFTVITLEDVAARRWVPACEEDLEPAKRYLRLLSDVDAVWPLAHGVIVRGDPNESA